MKTTPADKTQSIVNALVKAYSMELETVANYLTASVNLDGMLAEEVKRSLAGDVTEELGHAQQLSQRIKQLGGTVPSAAELDFSSSKLSRSSDTKDLETVVRGVIDDERAAIEHYRHVISETEGTDYVTQELCISLLADEEEHRTQFEGFLRDFEK
ncbi:MAG: ferritin-like domain-containing protein [Pirellulales bacterium]